MKKLENAIRSMFREELDIHYKLLNLILLAALVGGTLSLGLSGVFGLNFNANLVTMVLIVGDVISLWLANGKKKPQAAAILITSVANMLLFPMMYFVSGGTRSGMPLWMLLGLIFSWLILDGVVCYVMYAINAIAAITCILVGYYHPEYVQPLDNEFKVTVDIIQTMIVITCIFGAIFKYQTYVYEKQQKHLLEQDKELKITLEELQKANQAKSTFLANMSHEIRTPINAVLGMNEMILREGGSEKIENYATDIQKAGQTLLALINDILDFSKIESGKMEIFAAEYELSSLLNDNYNMIAMQARAKNLEFIVENNPTLPSALCGDEVRIRQILINLLSNAVKYTNEGTVRLKADWKPLDGRQILLVFSVEDTGVGIKKENTAQLFELFQRIEEKNNRNIEGTGLGLAITSQLLELMNGTIRIDSEYGKGSVFTVEIPQEIVKDEPLGDFSQKYLQIRGPQADVTENFIAPQARVLVVDDVPMNLKVIKELLHRTEIRIDTAESGEECLRQIQRESYDIIFLDHMMPQMDGLETLREMKKMLGNPNYKTPVIMLTANAVLGAKEEYLQAGFTDYLSKPVQGQVLEKMVRKYLPEELVLSAEITQTETEEPQDALSNDNTEQDFITKLNFLNTEQALMYCGHKEELYREFLNDYVTDAFPQELEELYRKQDWESYRRQAHTLKSLSLSIGADEFSEMAKQMEYLLKDAKVGEAERFHEPFVYAYRELLAKIKDALNC